MANVFDKILKMSQVEVRKNSEASIDWFREKASGQKVTSNQLLTGSGYKDNVSNQIWPGSMFLFQYDAKHKETLPYWDKFPLVFPFSYESDGFMGLNLHYLPHAMRASLMSNLMERTSPNRHQDLKLSYQILNAYSSLRYFKPCVKRYLYSHVKSQFLYITPEEWPIAIFLPLQRFQKASDGKVYADSRKMLR